MEFFRTHTHDDAFLRGAARLLWTEMETTSTLADLIAPIEKGEPMSYDLFDFTESIKIVDVDPASIAQVQFAWGLSPEGFGSWEGGFVLVLHDSLDHPTGATHLYVYGWCDTTGWGCQDGAACSYYDHSPMFTDLARDYEVEFGLYGKEDLPEKQLNDRKSIISDNHDYEPADLNIWLREHQGD